MTVWRRVCLFFLFWFFPLVFFAQERLSSEDYIIRYNAIAVKKMQEFKIPASITLAQGLLESGSGNSTLAREANNHFGIKCHKEWTGKTFHMDDDEKNECFRAYKHAEESFDDHSRFLTERSRYAFLFELDIMDYKGWAEGLKKAGYATNPRYPELLLNQVNRYNLHRYDSIAMGLLKKQEKKDIEAEPELISQTPPHPGGFEVVGKTPSGRYLHRNNGKKLLFAKEGESITVLARELNVYAWQLLKYNDLAKDDSLKQGAIVYVEKKARKSSKYKAHTLRKGETLKDVSQLYGVRLSRLEKLNHWSEGANPPAGTAVRLK